MDDRVLSAAARRDRPRPSLATACAYAIAAATFLLVIALAAAGAWLISLSFPNVFSIVPGLILLALAVTMRPRLGSVGRSGVVARDAALALHALVDEVAGALGTRPPHAIVVDADFNASWSVVGLRRRRVLRLGLPLLAMLTPQERVAVVAHEMAHAVNRDAGRGLVIASSVRSLSEIVLALSPEDMGHRGVSALLASAVSWIVRLPLALLLRLQELLLLAGSRRAEYHADALAADVAGGDAAISCHEKLLLVPSVIALVQHRVSRRAYRASPSDDLLAEITEFVECAPPRELTRRRRVAEREKVSLDATHPPTGRRIALLRGRGETPARVTLTAAAAARIDGELGRERARVAEELMNTYRGTLFS